jgi:hypothetical protein
VLDEVRSMLDMGFIDDRKIVEVTPEGRQNHAALGYPGRRGNMARRITKTHWLSAAFRHRGMKHHPRQQFRRRSVAQESPGTTPLRHGNAGPSQQFTATKRDAGHHRRPPEHRFGCRLARCDYVSGRA